jgi:hypothetical protein
VQVNGSLGTFSAAKADLVYDGFTATGTARTITVRDVLQSDAVSAHPQIHLGGTNADKTVITARTLVDDISIVTPGILTSLRAGAIGEGEIVASSIGRISTSIGALNADLTTTGAIGQITVKTGVDSGNWVAASFGAIKIGAGNFDTDLISQGIVTSLGVKGGSVTGQLVGARFGAVSITGGGFSGQLSSGKSATSP